MCFRARSFVLMFALLFPYVVATAQSSPDLVESAVSVLTSAPISGGSLPVSDTALNQGAGNAGASTTGFYLSTDGVTKERTSAIATWVALSVGASSGPVTTTLTLPTSLNGTYYVIACANYNGRIVESNTTNNCTASAAFACGGCGSGGEAR